LSRASGFIDFTKEAEVEREEEEKEGMILLRGTCHLPKLKILERAVSRIKGNGCSEGNSGGGSGARGRLGKDTK